MKPIKSARQWNRFCLWVALLGGNLAGIIFVIPALSMALGSPPWSASWHHSLHIIGTFVLMGTVRVLARAPRRRLFWIFVPPSLWLAWSVTDRIVMQNWPGLMSDFYHNISGAAFSLVFGCLLGLENGGIGKGREEPDVEPSFGEMAQSFSQEGVWPPPPSRPD